MKASLRWLGRALVAILVIVAAGILIPRPLWPIAEAARQTTEKHRILVLSNPIHTDIAIPVDDAVLARFGGLADAGIPVSHPQVRYIVFGWGGRSFYLETPRWSDLRPTPVFRALTLDRSVMHVDVATARLAESDAATSFEIDHEEFKQLLDFIDGSFSRENSEIMPIPGARYGNNDAFFEAEGSFNALVGCNTWTAAALRQAGLRTGLWNPLPSSLIWSLALFN